MPIYILDVSHTSFIRSFYLVLVVAVVGIKWEVIRNIKNDKNGQFSFKRKSRARYKM